MDVQIGAVSVNIDPKEKHTRTAGFGGGVIRNDEERETRKVLNAAALTYVAAAAVAVLELVRLILIYTGMNNED